MGRYPLGMLNPPHKRPGVLNPPRSTAPPADPIAALYGVGLGQIPLHLRPEDAVLDAGGNVTAVANRGGAGAAFNAAPIDAPVVMSEGGVLLGSGFLQLANPADLMGVRLFVVSKRTSGGQPYFLGGGSVINDGTAVNMRLPHTAMPDGSAASNINFGGTVSGPLRRALSVIVLHEFQVLPGSFRAWLNGVEAANAGTAPNKPHRVNIVGRADNPAVTPLWTGVLYDVVSLISDGSASMDAPIATIRNALAAKYGIALG